MSNFSSFYGGRQGASFVIVKQFDGIDIPQITGSEVYKAKCLAMTNDGQYFIYNNGFIEKTADNYNQYVWKGQYLDGSTVDTKPDAAGTGATSQQVLDIVYAEGMRQCFEQGGDTTDVVNYGEYVIIDTVDKNDPDNGKVYRRGMNFDYNPTTNPLAGAEYIGQIVGPQGPASEMDIDHYQDIIDEYGDAAIHKTYDEANEDLVPGSYINGGIRVFEDDIKYTYVTIKDEFNNVKGTIVGFRLPTLVQDFEARSMKPYEQRAVDPQTGKYYNYDLISEDSTQYVNNKWLHPFYQKWQIKVPHGYHGIDSTNIELVHTKTMPAGFKNDGYAGTALYTNAACTIPYEESGQAVVLTTPIDVLREIEGTIYHADDDPIYDASDDVISCKVRYHDNDLYVKKEDCYMDIIRYRETDYDNLEDGEITYIDIGEHNIIDRITLSDNGVLTAFYTHREAPYVYNQILRWIVDDGITFDEHGTVKIVYNTLDEHGENEYQEFYQLIKWIVEHGITIDEHGTIKIVYNTLDEHGDNEYQEFPQILRWIIDNGIAIDEHGTITVTYNTLDEHGDPEHQTFFQTLRWIDNVNAPGVTIDDNGTIKIYYNTLDENDQHEYQDFEQVLRWIDNVNAQGITIAEDGTVKVYYNTLHDDGTGTMVHDYQEFPTALDWITHVTLSQTGDFTVLFNNDTIQGGRYETTLNWIDYIEVSEDGVISFYYNSNHTDPAYQCIDRIKYISTIEVENIAPGETYEGTGDQKIHIGFNTGENEIIGNPLNYIIETVICRPSVYYPSAPYSHLLVYYADPALRQSLSDKWVRYPSTKYEGHVWDEWVDLGDVRGVPGGIHVIEDVEDESELKDAGGQWIPPEELTDALGQVINPEGAGWAVTVTPAGSTISYFYCYDYGDKMWYPVGSIDPGSVNPKYIIIKSEPNGDTQLPSPGDVGLLKENGFWFAQETAYYAF